MRINVNCSELIIEFEKSKHQFHSISVDSKELELVDHAKISRVTIASTLQRNYHIHEVIRKANKHVYFLIFLKRAWVPINDIVTFYSTCFRSVLEYCVPVFHHALPAYLNDELECAQKQALSIIYPNERLSLCHLETLKDRRIKLYNNFSDSIMSEPCHKLIHLLLDLNEPHYCLCKQQQLKVAYYSFIRIQEVYAISMQI